MKYIKFFFIFLFFICVKNYAYTESNVVFIDMQYIMDKSLAGQSLKIQLEDLHKKNLNEFKKKEDSLKNKEKEILAKNLSKEVKLLIDRFAKINEFNKEIIEKEFRAAVSESGLKLRDLIHPTRVALTGKKTGAGLFETLEVLGRERAIERLERLLKYWK